MSTPTMVALEAPCFPGLAVEYSITLHGKPLIIMYPPFFIDPGSQGIQSDDPALPVSNVFSSSEIVELFFY